MTTGRAQSRVPTSSSLGIWWPAFLLGYFVLATPGRLLPDGPSGMQIALGCLLVALYVWMLRFCWKDRESAGRRTIRWFEIGLASLLIALLNCAAVLPLVPDQPVWLDSLVASAMAGGSFSAVLWLARRRQRELARLSTLGATAQALA